MTIEELKDKHRNILYQENSYDVENHSKLSIQFAIEVLEEFNFDFCHECDNSGLVYDKIQELKQHLDGNRL